MAEVSRLTGNVPGFIESSAGGLRMLDSLDVIRDRAVAAGDIVLAGRCTEEYTRLSTSLLIAANFLECCEKLYRSDHREVLTPEEFERVVQSEMEADASAGGDPMTRRAYAERWAARTEYRLAGEANPGSDRRPS